MSTLIIGIKLRVLGLIDRWPPAGGGSTTTKIIQPTNQVVRRFGGSGGPRVHHAAITDLTFSPDGSWLLTASADGSLFVWDIPTARCVEWLRFQVRHLAIVASVHCPGLIRATVWQGRTDPPMVTRNWLRRTANDRPNDQPTDRPTYLLSNRPR